MDADAAVETPYGPGMIAMSYPPCARQDGTPLGRLVTVKLDTPAHHAAGHLVDYVDMLVTETPRERERGA